jgi:hypothetical protein
MFAGISLGRVTRRDYSGCRAGTPCDPQLNLPYGDVAFGLTLLGFLAVLIALVPAVFYLIARLQRLAATRRAS